MPPKYCSFDVQRNITRKDLAEIYEELSPRLFNYAVRLLGDAQKAEDCVSCTFSRFLKVTNDGIGPKDNLIAYLFKIAHNWIMDYYRRGKNEICDDEIYMYPGSKDTPESKLSHQAEQQKVRKALLKLPEDQLRVIMLRFYDDLSHEDTAEIMDRSKEATRALQYRALKRLHRELILDEL